VPSDDRETVRALLNARGKVDLVIPRGSAALIRMVVDESSVPTIETGAGVCHVYIDEFADLDKAVPIIINSKVQRPSVCNAAETLLVHSAIAEGFLPTALKALHEAGVVLHCDKAGLAIANQAGIPANQATDENFCTEYGTLDSTQRRSFLKIRMLLRDSLRCQIAQRSWSIHPPDLQMESRWDLGLRSVSQIKSSMPEALWG